eukprot:m.205176 g.205176  ORF g.205176 m.205176 type:complete len:358 (+) comp39657_c1_seq26:700-1773(+)
MLILLIIRMFNTPACVLTTIFQKTDALEWAILVFTIKIQFTSPGCLLITAQVVSIFSKDNAISIHSTVCRQTANLSSYSVLRNFSLFFEKSVFKICRDLTATPPPPTDTTTHPIFTPVNSSTASNGTSVSPSASKQTWTTTKKPTSTKTTKETTTTNSPTLERIATPSMQTVTTVSSTEAHGSTAGTTLQSTSAMTPTTGSPSTESPQPPFISTRPTRLFQTSTSKLPWRGPASTTGHSLPTESSHQPEFSQRAIALVSANTETIDKTNQPSTVETPVKKGEKGLSSGALAGIAIGNFLLLASCLIGIAIKLRKNRKKRDSFIDSEFSTVATSSREVDDPDDDELGHELEPLYSTNL